MDHPLGRQADLRQARREEIGLGHAPQHLALHPRGDICHEAGGRRAVHSPVAPACDLVQRAERQSALWEPTIHLPNVERQHAVLAGSRAVDLADPGAQFGQGRAGGRHGKKLLGVGDEQV